LPSGATSPKRSPGSGATSTQLRELVGGDDEIGKKLDFLLQETNREANTILSKSAELTICDAAIAIKTEVEKLREQAQNVE
jgi:uncharacterized protein (TIGR00255 family)